MSTVNRLKNGIFKSPTSKTSLPKATSGALEEDLTGGEAQLNLEGLDDLEQEIVLQLEEEFGGADDCDDPVQTEQPPAESEPVETLRFDTPVEETSTRLLEMRRKREMVAAMEEQIRDGAGLLGTLSKQAGGLSEYLEKTEAELKRLERIESTAAKLRIASEGIVRGNHEMKSTIEEQRKKIALLESKIAGLRDANESARTNMARLAEEKRVATVDLSGLQSEIARLEIDKRSLGERIEVLEEENTDLQDELARIKDHGKVVAIEMRKHEDDLLRKTGEIEELRDLKTQAAIEIEELKSRNASLESKAVEQRSRIEELTFELKSGRKEMEEVIRIKQQRVLELEARNAEYNQERRQLSEAMTPSIAFEENEDKPRASGRAAKPTAKSASKRQGASASKSASRSGTRTKQTAKAG